MSRSGFMYILLCENDTLYTGSTIDLQRRLSEHVSGIGANYTKKFKPVKLLYTEEYSHVALAFKREKQIQRWSQSKKWALVNGDLELLKRLSECINETHYENYYL
ncbi:MAG: GIY-YIG nuclease family protein [Crocinitomicaceae bacterium]